MDTTEAERLMTVADLAEFLSVPAATVYQWRYKGEGPRAMKVGKYLRFRRSDVEAWLNASAERRKVS